MEPNGQTQRVAVLIPCHNEEATIAKVISDFRKELPSATICVFDNCCTDRTAEIARDSGAMVFTESRQGKGFVIESMFDRVSADLYVMVDGDDTYPADRVHDLLEPVKAGQADMTVGARLSEFTDESFRPLHVMGNRLVRGLINHIFKTQLTDILSGYRAFSRKVIRRIPVVSAGFEVETELTVQMLYYRLALKEVPVPYRERPAGSESKLRTFRDGIRVLWKLFSLARNFKPLTFFGSVGLVLLVLGVLAGIGPIMDYIEHRYVYRVPMAILATGLVLLGAGCGFLGVLLHAINWRIKELHNVVTRQNV
jgi:glycosyltransferase involved in cell wall biosynthesis